MEYLLLNFKIKIKVLNLAFSNRFLLKNFVFKRFENNDVKTIVREVRRAYKDYDWGAGTVEGNINSNS